MSSVGGSAIGSGARANCSNELVRERARDLLGGETKSTLKNCKIYSF